MTVLSTNSIMIPAQVRSANIFDASTSDDWEPRSLNDRK